MDLDDVLEPTDERLDEVTGRSFALHFDLTKLL